MKAKLFAAAAVLAALLPLGANAVPIQYDVTYTATTGQTGTGSFFYDSYIKRMTNFTWDFGGVTGGLDDWHFAFDDVFGDTRSSFLFEVLTGTDAHSGVDCSFGGCGTGDSV